MKYYIHVSFFLINILIFSFISEAREFKLLHDVTCQEMGGEENFTTVRNLTVLLEWNEPYQFNFSLSCKNVDEESSEVAINWEEDENYEKFITKFGRDDNPALINKIDLIHETNDGMSIHGMGAGLKIYVNNNAKEVSDLRKTILTLKWGEYLSEDARYEKQFSVFDASYMAYRFNESTESWELDRDFNGRKVKDIPIKVNLKKSFVIRENRLQHSLELTDRIENRDQFIDKLNEITFDFVDYNEGDNFEFDSKPKPYWPEEYFTPEELRYGGTLYRLIHGGKSVKMGTFQIRLKVQWLDVQGHQSLEIIETQFTVESPQEKR